MIRWKKNMIYLSYPIFLCNIFSVTFWKKRQPKLREAFHKIWTHEDYWSLMSVPLFMISQKWYIYLWSILVRLNGYIIYQTLYLHQCFFCPMIDYMPSLPYYKDSVINLYDKMNEKRNVFEIIFLKVIHRMQTVIQEMYIMYINQHANKCIYLFVCFDDTIK